MPISAKTIESIFARIAVRYGSAWLAKYPGVKRKEEWAVIHADWADLLDGFADYAIEYGLSNLPADFPPNAAQFRAICSAAPERRQAALPAPDPTDQEKARSAEIRRLAMEAIAKNVGQGNDRKWVQHKIVDFRARIQAGERLSFAQRDWLRAVAHLEYGPDEMPGDFRPIPVEALPVAMRPDAHTVAPDAEATP